MPFINGKFYMNPAYGRALENARASEAASSQRDPRQKESGTHWVRIDGRHVLSQETQDTKAQQANQNQSVRLRQEQKTRDEAKAKVGYGDIRNCPAEICRFAKQCESLPAEHMGSGLN